MLLNNPTVKKTKKKNNDIKESILSLSQHDCVMGTDRKEAPNQIKSFIIIAVLRRSV